MILQMLHSHADAAPPPVEQNSGELGRKQLAAEKEEGARVAGQGKEAGNDFLLVGVASPGRGA